MPILPSWDVDACVREAERVASMGLRGVNMTSDPQDLGSPDLANRAWDPLWEVCADLEERGIAVRSDGALCVFFNDILGPDGTPAALIVQKSDGGFGYAATDLAAIRYRVGTLHAKRILYVVDARQGLHFRMVFETARRVLRDMLGVSGDVTVDMPYRAEVWKARRHG